MYIYITLLQCELNFFSVMMTMDCLKASVTSLIFPRVAVFNAQISRQIYLQINFQHEFSIMGRFGQSVQLGKQISNPLKYPIFEAFFMFSRPK